MKCCGECAHLTPPLKGNLCSWTCGNDESEMYGLDVEYDDTCVDFEERD